MINPLAEAVTADQILEQIYKVADDNFDPRKTVLVISERQAQTLTEEDPDLIFPAWILIAKARP